MNKKVISLALAAMMALGAAPAYAEVDITDEEVVYQVNRDSAGNMNVVIDKTTPALTFTEPLPNNEIRMVVDNKELSARGVSIDGRTLVPLRALGEALGATVDWDADKQEIRIEKMLYQADSNGNVTDSNRIILMNIGSKQSQENGVANDLDVAPQIIGGSTMVPARAITDFLEATIDWEEVSRTVTISSALTSSPQGAQWEQQDLAIGAANATSDYVNRVNKRFQEEAEAEKVVAKKNGELWAWGYNYGYIGVIGNADHPAYGLTFEIYETNGHEKEIPDAADQTFKLKVISTDDKSVVYTKEFLYGTLPSLGEEKRLVIPQEYLDNLEFDYEIYVSV